MHDLRHSFASFLVNAGCSIYDVQKLLGHANVTMTQRYSHLSQERLLTAASVAGDYVSLDDGDNQPKVASGDNKQSYTAVTPKPEISHEL
jgi:hypothetical protein